MGECRRERVTARLQVRLNSIRQSVLAQRSRKQNAQATDGLLAREHRLKGLSTLPVIKRPAVNSLWQLFYVPKVIKSSERTKVWTQLKMFDMQIFPNKKHTSCSSIQTKTICFCKPEGKQRQMDMKCKKKKKEISLWCQKTSLSLSNHHVVLERRSAEPLNAQPQTNKTRGSLCF